MGAVLKETMWDREEYFKGISIVKITAFVLFLYDPVENKWHVGETSICLSTSIC